MRIRNDIQNHLHIQKRDLVVNNTIKIQISAAHLRISQDGATLYSHYIQSADTEVSQLQIQDIADMKTVQ